MLDLAPTRAPELTGCDPLDPRERITILDRETVRQWGEIHAAAREAFGVGEVYSYAVRRGVVVRCTSLDHLARLTRRERARCGARWREDG